MRIWRTSIRQKITVYWWWLCWDFVRVDTVDTNTLLTVPSFCLWHSLSAYFFPGSRSNSLPTFSMLVACYRCRGEGGVLALLLDRDGAHNNVQAKFPILFCHTCTHKHWLCMFLLIKLTTFLVLDRSGCTRVALASWATHGSSRTVTVVTATGNIQPFLWNKTRPCER